MRTGLRWKVAVVCGVTLLFGVLGVLPGLAAWLNLPAPAWLMARQLKLGLDLQGGVQLVLRVNVDRSLDAGQREEAVEHTRLAIARRVDQLGVMEPTIVRQGRDNDRLLIELPGISDVERAKQIIGTTGVLEFRLVDAGPASSRERLVAGRDAAAQGDVVSESTRSAGGAVEEAFYRLRRPAVATGVDIRTARPDVDDYGLAAVTFTLTEDAGRRFSEVTAANIGTPLAVVLDGQVESVATIEDRIFTNGQIRGSFTRQQVEDLAVVLRSGSLPTTVTYLGQHTIGPSLGADSVRAGVAASIGGLVLVATFMVLFYGWWGVNALVSMLINLTILVGLLAYVEAALTLAGIAGLILTIGMGVDSNVLVFERIKEEIAAGGTVRAAMRAAFSRVFVTLLDTHVAALVAAACLFYVGSGSIRGFAVTLSLGLISNLFTSTFVSHALFELAHGRTTSR